MIVVNTKLYENIRGKKLFALLKGLEKAHAETKVPVYVACSAVMAAVAAEYTTLPILLQHVDVEQSGKATGKVLLSEGFEMGIQGCLVNHSEFPQPRGTIAAIVGKAPSEARVVVCSPSFEATKRLFKASKAIKIVAYEPRYLIGSATASVATERLAVFASVVELCKEYGAVALAGAGVKSREDVEAVLRVGGKGVLVASDVVTSPDPYAAIMDLCKGFGV